MSRSRSRRPSRGVSAVLAGLTVLLAGLTMTSAGAHAIGDPVEPPDPPEPTADYTISGTVSLVRCTTTAANVKVLAHGLDYPFVDKSVGATSSAGAIKYSVGSLPRGSYRITASTINGACAYGTSTLMLVSSPAGTKPKSTANVTYSGPHGTKVITGANAAAGFNTNFNSMNLVLSNYGELHPVKSRQANNGSYIQYPQSYAAQATIPEVVDTWEDFIFKMYASGVQKNGNSAVWNNGGIDLTLKFETDGDEIKYLAVVPPLYESVWYDEYDHNLTNIKVKLRLLPVVDDIGRLSYVLAGPTTMSATAADGCPEVPDDWADPCDTATAMWKKIMDGMAKATDTMMSSAGARNWAAVGLAPMVPVAQRGHLTKVVTRNGDIVLVW